MRIALITGASSGLGRTFALQIDRTEKHIDEIWLVARRRERLKEVAAMLDTPAKILAMDVTEEESIRQLELLLAGNGDAQTSGVCGLPGKPDRGNPPEIYRPTVDHAGRFKSRPEERTALFAGSGLQRGSKDGGGNGGPAGQKQAAG